MKKTTFLKVILLAFIFLFIGHTFAQTQVQFKPRFNQSLKGDMLLIGNNTLSIHQTTPYTGTKANNDFSNMVYVDIDTDVNTFSSSSADLKITSSAQCFKVVYAGLYWSAVKKGDKGNTKTVKFKVPKATTYETLTADQVIYDNGSYVSYKEVTNQVRALSDPNGTYTVADVNTAIGNHDSGANKNVEGFSAGWSLFIVYEDLTLPSKYITSFDGYSIISSTNNLTFNVSGFKTIPVGPVKAKYAFSAIEGDYTYSGDNLKINDILISPTERPQTGSPKKDNFFNSSVTSLGSVVTTGRNPNSSNTLGFDAGIFELDNNTKNILGNNASTAKISLGSSLDIYYFYFNAFAVDIIEPKIVLTKNVSNNFNFTNDISGQNVGKGDELWYKLRFENQGNDDAKDFTIEDVLPENIIFDEVSLKDNLPTGVTYKYTSSNRTLLFTIDKNLVKASAGGVAPYFAYEIKFKVKVIEDCYALSRVCNKEIKNQAFAKYKGVINETEISERSYANYNSCDLGTPQSTNFLVATADCKFEKDYQFCGLFVDLKAADGYDTYAWSRTPNGTVIGTGQIFRATQAGMYYVKNTSTNSCFQPITETITVTDGVGIYKNPVDKYADNDPLVVCANNGKFLPKIFLCGKDDFVQIETEMSGATIVWEKSSCVDVDLSKNCANESDSCVWTSAGLNGPNFKADTEGQYRLTITYASGCVATHYFNVYKEGLDPSVDKQDVICQTKGEIKVQGVPSGYLYSINGADFTTSNVFSDLSEGDYTITIKHAEVDGISCLYTVKATILKKEFSTTINISSPACPSDKGNIEVKANNVRGQYQFFLYNAGTTDLVDNSELTPDDRFRFDSLNPGKYDIKVVSEDGCIEIIKDVEIFKSTFSATAAITKALTFCSNGEITIYPEGGTPNYEFIVTGPTATTTQSSPRIEIIDPGTYKITAVDYNGCRYVLKDITIVAFSQPIPTITPKNISCYGATTGEIAITVNHADSGYSLSYSIDGSEFQSNPTFYNLAAGDYNIVVKYALTAIDGTVLECVDPPKLVTITQPAAAVTASMGVSELAGCGVPNKSDGKVRITNPQGGVAPYEYNFNNPDNPSDWTTDNDAFKAPGTYTLYVRDSNKCVFSAQVTVDREPLAPSITVSDPAFNCNGSANSTVTVTNSDSNSFSYNYLLDGVVNSNTADPKTFLNVPSGSHTISVEYLLTSVPTYSNLLNEDFGSGVPTTTSGIAAAYCFNDLRVNAPYLCGTQSVEDNQYSVTNDFWRSDDSSADPAWFHFKDHTTSPGNKAGLPLDPKGRFLLVNIGSAAGPNGVLYSKSIKDVIRNQPIIIDVYLGNLLRNSRAAINPDFIIELVDGSGTVVASQATGIISNNELWNLKTLSLNPGDNTNLTFKIRSGSVAYDGNDAVIDDIKVYQLPKACVTKVDFPFEVATGKAFTAQITGSKNVTCTGLDNGEITIAAENFNTATGYQYSINNGADWLPATTSPFTISGLAPVAYNVMIRPDATAAGTCLVEIPKTITSPLALVVDASVTKPATCTTGGTITAVGKGGTLDYEYQLMQGTAIVRPYQSNAQFLNVPVGTYTVMAKDANSCVSPASILIDVLPSVAVTASVVPKTGLCFDGSNATITVNVGGGTGTLSYQTSTNGGTTYSVTSTTITGTSFTHSVTATGSYIFKITDSNGCFIETTAQVINAKLTAAAAVSPSLDCEPAPSNQAVISGTISGGTAPFTVIKTTGPGTSIPVVSGTTFTYTTAVDGTYTFEIKDANDCITTTSATINPLVAITGTATATDVTCFGAANGSVILEALTGVAPYTFAITQGTATFVSSSNTTASYSGLVPGTYKYTVTDAKKCTKEFSFEVKQPEALAITASIKIPYTCDTPATIEALASKGNGSTYTYDLNRGGTVVATNNTGVFDGITAAGSYTVTATDVKGCFIESTPAMIILALNPPAAMTLTPGAVTCPSNTTTVTITDVRNSAGALIPAGLTYTILAPATATGNTSGASNGVFTDLAAGFTYKFEVKDANNCKYEKVITVDALPAIAASAEVVSNVKCFGTATGSIKYTISGFDIGTAYSYTIVQVSTGNVRASDIGTNTTNPFDITIPNLDFGEFAIVITNTATSCPATASTLVDQPAAALGITGVAITPITCTANATAVINTTGGWGSNTYTVTGPSPATTAVTQSTKTFTNLTAGDYTVTVTDANGCLVSTTFTIAPVVAVVASIDTTNSNYCYVAGSGATLIVSPETQTNYTYSINNGTPKGNGTFSGLTPGKYTIRVTDTSTGCYIDLAEQTIASPVSASTKLIKALDCTTTSLTSANATIEVTISNGYAPYEYQVRYNSGPYTSYAPKTSPFTYSAEVDGVYDFQIKDSKGCTTVVSRTIDAIVLPTFTATQVNVKCKGDNTGSITVTGSPASGTYTYILTPTTPTTPAGPAVTQTTNVFSSLSAGVYSVVIKDSKSCDSAAQTITITEPTTILAGTASATPLTCSATNTQQAATVTASGSGGTPFTVGSTYLYSFNSGAYGPSNTFTVNTAGTVTINVKDANGCIEAATPVTIAPFTPPTALTFTPANPITCNTITTDVTLAVTGGVGPFTYEIITPASAISNISGASNGIFTALSPNTYTFKVTDANGCTVTGTYKVDAVLPITVTGLLVANVSCNTGTDGSIRFTVDGNTTGYVATLTNSLGATIAIVPTITSSGSSYILDYAGLPAEIYTLNVSSPTACPVDDSVEVFEPTLVTITGTNATKVFCTKPISTITVSATGGTAPLEYAVVKQGVNPVAGDYQGSTIFNKDTTVDGLFYDVYVKDKNGCPATMGTVSVISNPAPAVTALGAGCLGTSYSITATPVPAAGLFGPLTYSLNGGGFVATTVFSITTAGDYTITIKDGNGCTATSNVVTVAPKLTLSSFLDKDITCASVAPFTNDAQITLTTGGGTGAYSYKVSINGGAFNTPVAADPYSFSGNIFTTSIDGSYQFEVSDSNSPSCTKVTTTAIVVTNPVLPVIADTTIPSATGVTVTQKIRCYGDATAAIAIAIDNTKGIGPYVFNVLRTAPTNQDYGTQTSGLTAGDYTITVTDAKGCKNTENITIDDAKPIVVIHHEVPVECVDDGTGVNVSKGSIIIDKITDGSTIGGPGGTAPYTYYVTGNNYNQFEANATGTTSVQFDVVDFGLYQINVVDANGCSMLVQDVLVATQVDKLDIAVNLTVDCTTLGTAEVKIATALAGTGPFHFAIYTGPPMVYSAINPLWKNEQDLVAGLPVDTPGSRKAYFSGLIPGAKYTFIVYDENTKCYYYQTADVIPVNTTIAIANVVPQNVTCNGSGNGKVSFDLSTTYGVDTDVTYQIFDSQSLVAMGPAVPVTIPATGSLPVGPVGSLPRGNYFVVIKEALGSTNPGCSNASTVFNIKESTIILSIDATILKQPNTCDLTAGIITAIAKDGTATAANPYLYQITTTNSEPAIGDLNWNVKNTFTLLAQNTYYIWVKDAYNCIKMVSKTLINDVAPTLDALPTVAVCPADLPKTITISGTVFTGSSKTYAIGLGLPAVAVAGTYKTTPDFVLTASGNYTFFIKDDNGCVAKAPYTINDEITSTLSVTKQLDCTVGTEDATIHGVVGGGLGTGNYSYTVQIGSGAVGASVPITGTTFDYAAATADTYTFVITDGTCNITEIIKVDPKVPTIFTTDIVAVKCFGDNTGSISVDVTSGEGPFEYQLSGGPVSYTYQDSNQFNLLTAATTYIVTVRSKVNLCEYTKTVTVAQPPLTLAVNAPTIVKLSCGPGNVAQAATVTLNGTPGTGTGAFEYSFNGSAYSTTNVFTVNDTGSTQTISYGVKDANNCEVLGTLTIDALNPPVFGATSSFTQTVITCLAQTSTVNVVSTNGVGTITYSTIAPSPLPLQNNTTGNFTNLAPGDYTFLVTDSNGCTDQVSYRVNDVTKINLQVTSKSDVICDATATGTATFAVTGFAGTYSVTVNGSAFTLVAPNSNTAAGLSLTGLAANTYLVRVTDDATGCFAEQSVTIANPTAVLASTNNVTPLGCTIMGAVTINATGGWGSYEYTLTTPLGTVITQNTNVFNNLSDITGAYTTSVKDANGCTVTDTFSLVVPTPPTASIAVSSDFCFDTTNASTLVVTASGGVGGYEYSIDNGVTFQSSNSFSGLTPGVYTVVVKDAFGCLSTAFIETIEPQLFANAVSTKEIFCIAPINGTIKITAVGGYGPYSYKVSTDNGLTFPGVAIPFVNATDTDFSVPAATSYVFEVTDSKRCVFVTTPPVIMADPTPVTLTAADITTTPVDCNGAQGTNNNGTITVNLNLVANNNPNYTYTLNQLTPVTSSTTQSTNVFTGLTAGDYEVIVTSGRGCTNVAITVTIAAVTPVVATATAEAFSCSPGNEINTTTVTVIGSGGAGTVVADYTYSRNGINWFASNTFEIADTGATQNLDFYVRDANGCVDRINTPLTIAAFPKLISAVATRVTQIDCLNPGEEILVTITGGSNSPSAFTYEVYQDGVLITAAPVAGNRFNYIATTAGSYYEFKIFDNNTACTITSSAYEVPVYNKMTVNATAAANVDCNGNATGKIEINITGYSGGYSYEIFNGATSVFTGTGNTSTNPFVLPHGLTAGTNYTVEVTETAYPQCTVPSNEVVITEPDPLALSNVITVANKNCFNEATATVPATSVSGGTKGYTYAFAPNGTPLAGLVFTSLNTATLPTTKVGPITAAASTFDAFDVWVKDVNGCTSMQTIQVTTDPMPTVTAVVDSQCPTATGYTITATGSGGKGTLDYSLDGNSFQSSNIFTVTTPKTYDVWVRDANQCIVQTAVSVVILEPLQLQAEISIIPTCNDADGEVTLTASGGSAVLANYLYSQDGTTYVATNVFTGLVPSVTPYTFFVKDMGTANQCIKQVDVTIEEPNTAIAFTLSPTGVTCNGDSDGTITVEMATPAANVNNNPIYKYSIDGGITYQASTLFSGLAGGNYTITVTSGRLCSVSQPITVFEPAPIVVPIITPVQFGCRAGNARNFATITVDPALVTGGSNTYLNYEFIKVGTSTNTQVYFGKNNVYTVADVTGGSYIVNVYDSKGCIGTTTAPIIIAPYVQLDKVNVNVTRPITCANPEDITVSVASIGGTPANLQFTVQDVIYDNSVTPPIVNKGSAYNFPPVSVVGGVATFTNLAVGNYLITVKNLDTNCEIQGVHYVNEPNTFDLALDSVVDVTCFSDTNGSVEVTFVDRLITTTPVNGNDAGKFTYTLEDALGMTVRIGTAPDAGPITISGLAAGTYTITATLSQSPSCTVSKNFTITGPTAALDITETHTEVTCVTGNNDGTISVTATGGWPGAYEYQLLLNSSEIVAYSRQTVFTGLTAGTYTINVRDSKGCEATTIIIPLKIPDLIGVTISTTTPKLLCNGDNSGVITVDAPTGGQGSNYSYTLNTTTATGIISSGPHRTSVFTRLRAGIYSVTVTDGFSCSATSSTITIEEPGEIQSNLVVATTQTCLTEATLTLSATGGTGPYTYSADGTFTVTGLPELSGSFTVLTPATFSVPVGTYHYYVKDASGCVDYVSNDIRIDPLYPLIINLDVTNAKINCAGDATGVIVAIATGGLGDYSYTLFDGANNIVRTAQPKGYFDLLPTGKYIVRVDSGDCRYDTAVIDIIEPDFPLVQNKVVTNITCAGEGDGKIVITASGGTGIIKYAISPDLNQFFESNVFDNLKPGSYDYIVQDENGCYIYTTGVVITEPNSIIVTTIPGTEIPEVCAGDADGAFSINITGGSAPYSVSLDDVNGTYTPGIVGQTQFDFANLSGSEHIVYVRDANNCTSEHTVILGEAVTLNPKATVNYDCVNNSASNSVTVTVDASNLPADLDYALDGSTTFQASNVFTNLTAGRHTIDVRHTNGCIKQVVFDILQVDPLTLTLADGGLNEIVATATGGGGNYQYTLDGESYGNKSNFIIYKSGDYTVTVTDVNGCTATATRYFEFIDIKIPNVFTPNGDGNNDTWAPTNTINYKDLVYDVFDRYGRKLGSYREGQFWDGKYNGAELPSGDYWYVIKIRDVKDAREFVGHFTLYR